MTGRTAHSAASTQARDLVALGVDAFADPTAGRALVLHGAIASDAEVLGALRRAFAASGGRVIQADCAEGAEALRPFGALARQLVDGLEGQPAAGALRALLAGPLSAGPRQGLDRALLHGRPGQARLNDRESIRRAFAEAAGVTPVLVVLTGLERATTETLGLIEALLDDSAGALHRVGVGARPARPSWLFTVRDDTAAGRAALIALRERPSVIVRHAGPLSPAELGRTLSDPALAEKLLRLTDGRHDRLRQLVALLPEDLGAVARLRLSGLTASERAVLQAAALSRLALDIGELSELSGSGGLDVRRLVERGMLVSDGERLRVAERWVEHLEAVEPTRLRALHARCADLAEQRAHAEPALFEHVAEHRLSAGQVREAGRAAVAAAEHLSARGAWERASALCEAAAAAGDDSPELVATLIDLDVARGQLDQALARCGALRDRGEEAFALREARLLRTTGQLQPAERALERLLALATPEQRGEVVFELASVRFRRGALDSAEALIREHLEQADDGIRAELQNVLGNVALRRGDFAAAAGHYEALLDRLADDEALRSVVLHNLGLTALSSGDYATAERHIQSALGLIDSRGDHLQAAGALHNLGIAQEYLQRFGLALAHFRRSIETLENLGERSRLANAISTLADLYLTLGETWRARKLLEHAIRLAEEHGLDAVAAIARLRLARASLLDGDSGGAERDAREVAELLRSRGHHAESTEAWLIAAQAALRQGRAAQARQAAEHAARADSAELRALAALVEAELAAEDDPGAAFSGARRAAEQLGELGQRFGQVHALAVAVRAGRRADLPTRELEQQMDAAWQALLARVPAEHRDAAGQTLAGRARSALHTPAQAAGPIAQAPRRRPAERFHRMIGGCRAMQRVFDMVRKVAPASAPILLLGESGTGKELVAEAIHLESARRRRPFVRVNAASFVESLLESELFGHEKGAFTGAVARREGAFELADGGTLFLDEIGDISPRTQVSLLRVLQEGELRRVGGQRPIRVDVRVICATNRNLEQLVEQGSFRLDLYYRIKGVTIELPALRERGEDLVALAENILERLSAEHGRTISPTAEALALLRTHRWPGNVRELENVLRTAFFLCDGGGITPDLLRSSTVLGATAAPAPAERAPLPEDFDLKTLQRELEMKYIIQALEQSDGNITHAADLLGCKRPRLSQKIKEYDLRSYTGKPS